MKVRVAAIQMEVGGSKEKNLEKALSLLNRAAEEGCQAACLPDYFLTDTPTQDQTIEDIRKLAEPIPGSTISEFAERARKYKMYIEVGSIIEDAEDGNLYSTGAFIGPDGKLMGKVRKSHPENAPAKHEIGCGISLGPGDYPVFDTEIGKIGIMLDMDGIAVEVPRILGLKGAEIIFWPVNFSAGFTENTRLAARFYSKCTGAYVVCACRVGWHKDVPVHNWAFFGESRASLIFGGGSGIAKGGYYIASVPDFSEGVAIATIEPAQVAGAKKKALAVMPYLRRPETYGPLTEIK